MIPAILAGKVLKKILPKILDILMQTFPGLEKIEKLVNYMEEENETDKQVKLHDAALKGLATEIDDLKADIEKMKHNG